MAKKKLDSTSVELTLRVEEFNIPPIREALVLGRKSPIGCVAMSKALSLLHTRPFEHIALDDDTIGDVLVRKNVLLRVPREKLIQFILERIKPLMMDDEIMHLDIVAAVRLQGQV